jgi:hypothetical protein
MEYLVQHLPVPDIETGKQEDRDIYKHQPDLPMAEIIIRCPENRKRGEKP